MVLEKVRDQILDDLDKLTPDQQLQAAELVHRLISDLPRGVPGRSLLRFSGVLDEQSAHEMTVAIEEGCRNAVGVPLRVPLVLHK